MNIVSIVTVPTMVVEIVAGIDFGSMALLADGLHMGSHASALPLLISLPGKDFGEGTCVKSPTRDRRNNLPGDRPRIHYSPGISILRRDKGVDIFQGMGSQYIDIYIDYPSEVRGEALRMSEAGGWWIPQNIISACSLLGSMSEGAEGGTHGGFQ